MISLVNVIKSLGNKICSHLLKKFLIQTINFLNESYEYIFTLQFPVFFLTYCTTGIAENELAQYPIPHKLLFHFQYKKQDVFH